MTTYIIEPAQKNKEGYDSLCDEFRKAGIRIIVESARRCFITAKLDENQVRSLREKGHAVSKDFSYSPD